MKIPNTFGLDVEAAVFLEYSSVEELEKLIAAGRITSPYLHIGGGSNLLFTGNYEGVILHSRIGGIEVTAEDEEKVSVRVGAGVVWDDFVGYCADRGWYGVENSYSWGGGGFGCTKYWCLWRGSERSDFFRRNGEHTGREACLPNG